MQYKRVGEQTVLFTLPPKLISAAVIVGDMEGKGPLGNYFDLILEDDTWGERTWEKAERKMFEYSVRMALDKLELSPKDLDCLLGGDLLNQIISANYAARELNIPFLGLYGACSTMAQSLLIGAMMIDGGFAKRVACAATSHFSTAERQYRFPLEMGSQMAPTAQRTVTGAGASILCDANSVGLAAFKNVSVTGGTIGRVVDFGISDASNMGAAMAPAARDTFFAHLKDTGRTADDYDLVVTGDLGRFGAEMFVDLCGQRGVKIGDKHFDCGNAVFGPDQKTECGGSGCGCSAAVLNAYLLGRMEQGELNRVFFMATGALMSPTSSLQSESIPGVAHGVILERRLMQ
ncbi:MAG: stage V sporulation protein AD [Clostridiaceae bacterium]|nr:stage V sporulation protein AD [Eubacteriales bacterium]